MAKEETPKVEKEVNKKADEDEMNSGPFAKYK